MTDEIDWVDDEEEQEAMEAFARKLNEGQGYPVFDEKARWNKLWEALEIWYDHRHSTTVNVGMNTNLGTANSGTVVQKKWIAVEDDEEIGDALMESELRKDLRKRGLDPDDYEICAVPVSHGSFFI